MTAMAKQKKITLYVPERTAEELRQFAFDRRVSQGEIVQLALELYWVTPKPDGKTPQRYGQ